MNALKHKNHKQFYRTIKPNLFAIKEEKILNALRQRSCYLMTGERHIINKNRYITIRVRQRGNLQLFEFIFYQFLNNR